MNRYPRLPTPRNPDFDIQKLILSTKASLLAQVFVGELGVQSLYLCKEDFSSTIEMSFTKEEIQEMEEGLKVPTYDESGRVFEVVVRVDTHNYILKGDNGWRALAHKNDLREKTVITIWIYRESMALVPIKKLPRFLVRVEDSSQHFCIECKGLYACMNAYT